MYKIKYQVEHGEFTKEDLGKHGGCHGIIIHSLLFSEDGSRSEAIISCGPDGNDLPDIELFKSWVALAHELSSSAELGEGSKILCKTVFKTIQDAILKKASQSEEENHDQQ